MLFLQPSEETCGLADQKKKKKKKKKKDKRSYICQKQFRFQMNYIYTKGNIPTQIHVLLLIIMYSRQKTTRRSAVRNWEFQGKCSHQMNWRSRHKPGMYQYMK